MEIQLTESQIAHIRSQLRADETVSEYIQDLIDRDREIFEDMGKYMPKPTGGKRDGL